MTDVTVVVATGDPTERLRRCIDALAEQTAPPESYEVVIVETGSSDGSSARLASGGLPFALRIERGPSGGLSAARNRGIMAAAGRYCLFIDDRAVAEPLLIEEHLRAQRDQGGAIAIGPVRLRAASRSGLAHYAVGWWNERYRRLDERVADPDLLVCDSGNLSVPTDAIRSARGFDQNLAAGGGSELAERLVRRGLPLVYLRRAAVEKQSEAGFGAAVRAFDRLGRTAGRLYRRNRELPQGALVGDFSEASAMAIALRRLLLAVRAPAWPVAPVDRLLARRLPVRLCKLLQYHCFWRSLRRELNDEDLWRRLTRGTVILMYHALGRPGEKASRFVIPARRFRRQLAWLRMRRHPVLTLDDYSGHREQGQLPPPGSVVITFDDGYADTGEVAAPLLRRQGLSATVFVVTDAVGKVNHWEAAGPLSRRPLLSWDGVRKLREEGIAIGAHSVSHPRLTELDPNAADREVRESRARLERELGSPVKHFAYPYGRTSPELMEIVGRASFDTACGVQAGPNTPGVPIHDLRRMEVWGTRPLLRFALDLWLGRPLRSPRPRRPAR